MQSLSFNVKISDQRLIDLGVPEIINGANLSKGDKESNDGYFLYYFDEETSRVLEMLVVDNIVYDPAKEDQIGSIQYI